MAKKTAKQLIDLSRSQLINFYHLKVENSQDKFLTTRIWEWVVSYFHNRFGKREAYRAYPSTDGDTGVYPLISSNENVDEIIIVMAGDWATNTTESGITGEMMRAEKPDYSIHLGDVYYVGEPQEIEDNFGKKGVDSDEGDWAYGKNGFLALPGNHEFYSKGTGFYDNLLAKTKIKRTINDTNPLKQKAGFFCLENEYWRIIGLDTGYTSVGIPIFEFIFPANCKLKDEQVNWLRNVVKLGDQNDKRGIIILSHHQYYSAFENGKGYPIPAQQLAEIMGTPKSKMPVIWYWGHQHMLSIYNLNSVENGIQAYGRCIGHGGMPVDVVSILTQSEIQCATDSKLLFYDPRFRGIEDNQGIISPDEHVGYNGFVKMILNGNSLIVEHIQNDELQNDISKKINFIEKWSVDTSNGVLSFELPDDTDTILTKFSAS